MSQFDPNLFLDATTTEVNERRPPLPPENPASPDGLYTAIIDEIKPASGTIEKGDRAGQPWLSMVVPLKIQVPPEVQASLGLKLEKGYLVLTDRVFIDLTPQNTVDNSLGRNMRQKAYREALDMNKPGDTWSWRRAVGQPIKVKIDHELYEGNIQERIGKVVRP